MRLFKSYPNHSAQSNFFSVATAMALGAMIANALPQPANLKGKLFNAAAVLGAALVTGLASVGLNGVLNKGDQKEMVVVNSDAAPAPSP